MKKWWVVVFFLCLAPCLFAQKVVISNPIDLVNSTHYDLIGYFDGRFYMYLEEKNEIQVIAFDEELKRLWTRDLEMTEPKVNTNAMVAGADEFHHYYSYRKRDTTYLVHDIYDLNAKLKESYFLLKDPELGSRFKHVISKNGTHIAFFQEVERGQVYTFCYDQPARAYVWENTFQVKGELSETLLDLSLTNQGLFYMVLNSFNEQTRKDDHLFQIFSYSGGNEKPEKVAIPFDGYLVHSGRVVFDELNQQLNVVGYYSERNLNRTSGLFFFSFNRGMEEANIYRHKWSQEIIQKLFGASGAKGDEIEHLVFRDVVLREDGGLLLMGEIEKIFERRSSFAERNLYSRGGYWVDFVYEDILLSSVHPNGNLHYHKILHKRQFSQDDNGVFSSFFVFTTPSLLRVIFNDEIQANSTASSYGIFGDGSTTRTSILSTQYQKLQLRFQEAFQYSSTSMIVPSEFKGMLKLVQIQF